MKIIHITRQNEKDENHHLEGIHGFQSNGYSKEPAFLGDTLSILKTDIEGLLNRIEENVDLTQTPFKNS